MNREQDLNPPEFYDDGPDEAELDRRADARREADDDRVVCNNHAEAGRLDRARKACSMIQDMLLEYMAHISKHPAVEISKALAGLADIESILRGIK